MRDFFHGWRRKVGCVVLVMALVLMGLWMRSLAYDFGFASDTYFWSSQGYLRWTRYSEFSDQFADITHTPLHWFSELHTGDNGNQFPAKTILHYQTAGFVVDSHHLVDFNGIPMHRVDTWIAPYWSLALPLTLLSAYLILWKPRKRTEPDHA